MKQVQWSYFDNPSRDIRFSSNHDDYYQSERWRFLREERLRIDHYHCAYCGSTKDLHVHHLHGLMFDDPYKDLITLCKRCHEKEHQFFDQHLAIRQAHSEWVHKQYEERRIRKEEDAKKWVEDHIYLDVMCSGKENLCNIDTIKRLYGDNAPISLIQTNVSLTRTEAAYIYLFSGYTQSQAQKMAGLSYNARKRAIKDYYYINEASQLYKEEILMKQIDMTTVKEAGDFSRPAAGPYICRITAVEDIEDREYLKISYDIDQGEFKGYYTEAREAHPDWTWMGAYVRSYKPTALGMFKRFCSAVSKSNGNFVFDAGNVNSDESTLVGRKIGLVFQEEEYYSNSGDKRTRLVVNREFPVDKLAEQKTPEPKRLPEARPVTEFVSVDVPAGTDEEIPF